MVVKRVLVVVMRARSPEAGRERNIIFAAAAAADGGSAEDAATTRWCVVVQDDIAVLLPGTAPDKQVARANPAREQLGIDGVCGAICVGR